MENQWYHMHYVYKPLAPISSFLTRRAKDTGIKSNSTLHALNVKLWIKLNPQWAFLKAKVFVLKWHPFLMTYIFKINSSYATNINKSSKKLESSKMNE